MVSGKIAENPALITEMIDYKEAIRRLSFLAKIFSNKLKKIDCQNQKAYLPIMAFSMLITAQLKALRHLNDEYLHSPLAWDTVANIPSYPSMVADAQAYIKYCKPENDLTEIILNSFFGWTLFAKQEIFCCCGRFFKERKISLEIMLNHILKTDGDSVIIKQLLGVKTDDKKHLKHHYDFQEPSQRIDDLGIIWKCENRIRVKENLEIECFDIHCSKQFNADEFKNRILLLTKEE